MNPKVGYLFLVLLMLSPCGNFTFKGNTIDGSSINEIDMNLRFAFDPAACDSKCTCDLVCYIQIVRTVDLKNGENYYPSTEKKNRATEDGWYIDRVYGRQWGYYGRNDDGSFDDSLKPGSDKTDAILYDSPWRPEKEPWLGISWQAVSVPVCVDGSSVCLNNMVGYYFWSWGVDDSGIVTGIIKAIASADLENSVDKSVIEWNNQAPGLGKKVFPKFSKLLP